MKLRRLLGLERRKGALPHPEPQPPPRPRPRPDIKPPLQADATPAGPLGPGHIYDQDGLRSYHNHEFMDDRRFTAAYRRGVQAAGGRDYTTGTGACMWACGQRKLPSRWTEISSNAASAGAS